jgi:hypothetical protein
LLTTFTSPTPAPNDGFGWAVAAVGTDQVLIGAYLDDRGAPNAGAAFLFSTNGTLLTTFTNPTPAASDSFGYAVAAVGTDRVLIGAHLDDTGATNAGAVYLFSTGGALLTTFTNPSPAVGDAFGISVAAVGTDRVLIGAWQVDTGANNAGAAYLFSTDGTLLTTFTNPAPGDSDYFGRSVAAVGTDRVLIGAHLDDTGATNAGAAYLFGTDGTLLTTFTNPTPEMNDGFGWSVVAVGTDRVLIGADHDDTGATNAGAAYLFRASGALLTTLANPTPEPDDRFGSSVAVVGSDRVLLGTLGDNTGAIKAGAAYLISLESYTPGLVVEGVRPGAITGASLAAGAVTAAALADQAVTGSKIANGAVTTAQLADGTVTAAKLHTVTNWSLTLSLTNPTPANNDSFASSVAAWGSDYLLVGTPADDTGAPDAGVAYVFDSSGTPVVTLTHPAPEGGESFGASVAAGQTVMLVGAPRDNAGAIGVGAAYLFGADGTLLTTFTNPVPADYAQFGWSVAVQGIDRALVGAPQAADSAGMAYWFQANGTLLTTFTNPEPASGDAFGYSIVAVGDGHVLIGAPFDDTGALNAGAAYLFSTNGTLLTTFTNPSPVQDDQFGRSLAAVGNDRVLIAAPWDHTGAPSTGIAYLFSTNGTLLTTFTNPTPASGENFGYSVAALGNSRVVIGVLREYTFPSYPGAAYVFNTNGLLQATIANPTSDNLDLFGGAVAAAGTDRVLIGASSDDAGALNAGAAHLFELESHTPGLVADGVRAGSIDTLSLANGAVTSFKLASGAVGSAEIADGSISASDINVTSFSTVFWKTDGNAGTAAGTQFLGTTDNQALELRVNNLRALRLEDNGDGSDQSLTPDGAPNVVGGSPGNFVAAGVVGATIAGGGATNFDGAGWTNAVLSDYGAVGGGLGNRIDGDSLAAAIAGGHWNNVATKADYSAIGGGYYNNIAANAWSSTIAGGYANEISTYAAHSTIGGGSANRIAGYLSYATIAGGSNNKIDTNAFFSAIGGGAGNRVGAESWYATIAGGVGNDIGTNARHATVCGGLGNGIAASSASATIAGGYENEIGTNANYSTIGGGSNNVVASAALCATIAGGSGNQIGTNSPGSVIGGGRVNTIQTDARYATIGGGSLNMIQRDAQYATIGGGYYNTIQTNAWYATIGGGYGNTIKSNAYYATIGGGEFNYIRAMAFWATIGGGDDNLIEANAFCATIGGGDDNLIQADASSATISGGNQNMIQTDAHYGTIGGGADNTIQTNAYYATIGGGYGNQIARDSWYGTVAGGHFNFAANYAFAAGRRAKANHTGAFVWGDSTDADFASTANNQFLIRASGGVGIGTASPAAQLHAVSSTGNAVYGLCSTSVASGVLGENQAQGFGIAGRTTGTGIAVFGDNADPAGWAGYFSGNVRVTGTINPPSDRHVKRDFEPVDPRAVLEALVRIPVQSWAYTNNPSVRHLGPVAQDFQAAFGLGAGDQSIATVDADGVALAAIQGLNQKLEAENQALKRELAQLKALVQALAEKLNAGGE